MSPRPIRFSEFAAAIKKGHAVPVYFLCGPDAFLHEEGRRAAAAAIPLEARNWCFTEIAFKPGELVRQLEPASQIPMLSDRVVVYVSCPDDFGRATDADCATLAEYLKNPSSFATVIFAARRPDRRRRFIQALEKGAALVEMMPPTPRDAAAWLADYLRQRGITIQARVADIIARRFEVAAEGSERGRESGGVNLLWMRTEIDKLLTARRGVDHLEEADVAFLAEPRDEHEIGKLLTALAARKVDEALAVLRDLMVSKESETLLLWCVGDLFRQALKAAGGPLRTAPWRTTGSGYSTFEIAPRVRASYSREEMTRAITLVRAADLAIKSSWKDSGVLLEGLIWQVATGKNAAAQPSTARSDEDRA